MMDDLERYEPTPGSVADHIRRHAREHGIDAHALRPKADPDGKRRVTLTFFGEFRPGGGPVGREGGL